jgi:hypothetical protein
MASTRNLKKQQLVALQSKISRTATHESIHNPYSQPFLPGILEAIML